MRRNIRYHRKLIATCIALFAGGAVATAHASCGAGFCAVNTDWSVQGAWVEPGVRVDLRYEYVDQDQPRAGTRRVGVGEVPRHHDEIRTISRNLLLGVDATLTEHWGVSASLPVVQRSHQHIHNHHGNAIYNSWDFRELGDAQLLARYQSAPRLGNAVYGLRFGAKLPTGSTDVSEAGEVAERSLQPGTGTVDAIVGAYMHRPFMTLPASWFAEVKYQRALDEDSGYRPGYEVTADLGGSYQLGARTRALLQLNYLERGQDAGAEAEPEDTGGRYVYLSPGLSFAPAEQVQVYGLVQLPLYQRVEGVQLTADWALAVGVSMRF